MTNLEQRRLSTLHALGPAEGITARQALTVVQNVVIDDFAQSGADRAACSGAEESAQDGAADSADQRAYRTPKGADDQAEFSAVENACSAAGGTGHRANGTACFFAKIFSLQVW